MANLSFEQINKTEVHQSAITLVVKVVFLEVIFIFLNLMMVFSNDIYTLTFGEGFPVFTETIIAVVLMIVRLVIIGKMILNWMRTYWIIGKDKISFYKGILNKSQEEYRINNIESVTIRQSFAGKRLNYGTLELYLPILSQKVYIEDIPYPHVFGEIIGEMISSRTNSDRIFYKEGILKG